MEERDLRGETRIAEEHSAIRVVMQWIDAELTRQLDTPEGVRGDGPLLGPLTSFRDHLRDHFAFEEESGLLAAALSMLPDAADKLRDWVAQHRSIMMRVEGAIRRLERAAKDRTLLPASFAIDLRNVFAGLRAHDRYENQLLGKPRSTTFRIHQRAFESKPG